jgi:hypothetical protein
MLRYAEGDFAFCGETAAKCCPDGQMYPGRASELYRANKPHSARTRSWFCHQPARMPALSPARRFVCVMRACWSPSMTVEPCALTEWPSLPCSETFHSSFSRRTTSTRPNASTFISQYLLDHIQQVCICKQWSGPLKIGESSACEFVIKHLEIAESD